MAKLPQVPRRLETTQAPTSAVTGAEIAAPYASLGKALDRLGEGLEDTAVVMAQEAGQKAVTRDENGEVNVSLMPPMTGRAGAAFNRIAKQSYIAQVEQSAQNQISEHRIKNDGRPEDFKGWADKYLSELVARQPDEALRNAVRTTVGARSDETYRGMLLQQHNVNLQRATTAIDTRLTGLTDDLEVLARKGGVDTPEFHSNMRDLDALLSEKVKNPLIAFPQEKANEFRDVVVERAQGAAIQDSMERLYQEHGYDAARTYLRSAVKELGATLKAGDKIERRGLSWLRTEEAGFRGLRDGLAREWSAAKPQIETLPAETLAGLEERANSLGATRVAADIRTHRLALEINKELRNLPPEDRARLLSGQPSDDLLAMRESSGKADAQNKFGYSGTWQHGAPRLATLNVYQPGAGEDLATWSKTAKDAPGKWSGTFNVPGFPQVRTIGDFLRSADAQRAVREIDVARMDQDISANGFDRYIGQMVGGVQITQAGLRNMMHLGGVGGARAFLESNGRSNVADANGTTVGDYARMGTLEQSREGFLARGMMLKEMRRDLDARFASFENAVKKQSFPELGDLEKIGAEVAAIGTQQQKQRIVELAALSQYGRQFEQLPEAARKQLVSEWDAKLRTGASRLESEIVDTLRTTDTKIAEAYRKDPYGAAYRFADGYKPSSMSDGSTLADLVLDRVHQQHQIRADQRLDAFSIFRPAEAATIVGNLAAAPGANVAETLNLLRTSLPVDMWKATIGEASFASALVGMSKSADPIKMSAVLSAMDEYWRKDPAGFDQVFGKKGALEPLQLWQWMKDGYAPSEIAERIRRLDDPAAATARKALEETAKTEAGAIKINDIADGFRKSWIPFTGPGAPINVPVLGGDGLAEGTLKAEFDQFYKQARGIGLPADEARRTSIERLKTAWGASEVGGYALMRNPPEQYYPMIDGSYAWMKPQIERDIAAQLGARRQLTPILGPGGAQGGVTAPMNQSWDYRLIADAATQADISANRLPSYVVVYRDNTLKFPQWNVAMKDGKQFRFRFDPSIDQERSRADFMERRHHALNPEPGIANKMGWVN